MITIRKEPFLFLATDCPEEFDPLVYACVARAYGELSADGVPIVEIIFEKAMRVIRDGIYKDVLRRVKKENPTLPDDVASDIASSACHRAVEHQAEQIKDEVMVILNHKGLCYLSFEYGLNPSEKEFSVFNNPQQSLFDYEREDETDDDPS